MLILVNNYSPKGRFRAVFLSYGGKSIVRNSVFVSLSHGKFLQRNHFPARNALHLLETN